MPVDTEKLANSIVKGNVNNAVEVAKQGLDEGMSPHDILNKGLIRGMDIICDLWVQERIFIPEVLLSAKAMHAAMNVLRPILEASKEPPRGVVVLGTVQGDVHDIGQNIVGMMLKGNGFEVHNVGTNASPEKFIAKIKEVNANIVGLSAMLTTTMPMQRETIKALDAEGLLEHLPVMVGGAPVTADWAEKIGSDGYAPDAARAVGLAKQLVDDLKEATAS